MSQDDEDSIFEQALKGDLPSATEQARLRKRLFAAGLSAGSGLAATSAASAQASWGATVVAKVAALSWPMTLVIGAAVAAPIAALPVWLAPNQAKPAPIASTALRPASSTKPSARLARDSALDVAPPVDAATPSPLAAPIPPRAASASVVTAGHAPETVSTAVSAGSAVAGAAFATPSRADVAASEDSPSNARTASTLAAETALLDRAFAEIAAGHRASAAALIAEHARRFPNGLLSQERERARTRLAQSSQNSKAE